MNVLPRSLFGRNLLLIVGLILLGQVIAALVFFQVVQRPRLAELAGYTSTYVAAVNAALSALPPEDRARYIERMNASARLHIEPAAPVADDFVAAPGVITRQFVAELQRRLGAATPLGFRAGQGNYLWVKTRLGTDTAMAVGDSPLSSDLQPNLQHDAPPGVSYWVRISADRLTNRQSGTWAAAPIGRGRQRDGPRLAAAAAVRGSAR
jgi:hypothetical protein